MIITSIKGEKFLKYFHLELNSLPHEGIIGISGFNESGKSSIGEIICFALFGRTFSLKPDQIKKIIHWGESHCSVVITFLHGKEHYSLSRFIDNDGNHSAKLVRLDDEITIATGVLAVTSTLSDLINYDFDNFINSFYLAQREITAPHPRSETIKVMAGISLLEIVSKKIESEIYQEEQELAGVEQKINDTKTELTGLAFDKNHLRTLRKHYTANNDILSEIRKKSKGLEQTNRRYKEVVPLMQNNLKLLNVTNFIKIFLLMLSLVLGSIWILFTQFNDKPSWQWLINYLINIIPDWSLYKIEYLKWMLFGGLGLFTWFLVFWGVNRMLNTKMQRLNGERINLALTLRKIYQNINLYRPTENHAANIEYPSDDEINHIAELIIDNTAPILQIENIVNRTLAWLVKLINLYEQKVANFDAAILIEEKKQRQAENLEEMIRKFDETLQEHQCRIKARRLASQLLQGSCGQIAQHFNREVRDLVGFILPLFTDGRYQYLRIDNDLNVQIFSKKKQDFMELDEVSSGTQRQTMLALRLTLAHQLLERTTKMPHFLFLDESFAFFDENRTRQSLAVLPNLNDKLKQVFIIAQSFPEEIKANFAQHIECIRDNATFKIN